MSSTFRLLRSSCIVWYAKRFVSVTNISQNLLSNIIESRSNIFGSSLKLEIKQTLLCHEFYNTSKLLVCFLLLCQIHDWRVVPSSSLLSSIIIRLGRFLIGTNTSLSLDSLSPLSLKTFIFYMLNNKRMFLVKLRTGQTKINLSSPIELIFIQK